MQKQNTKSKYGIDENLITELNKLDWAKILKLLTAYASFKVFRKNIPHSKKPQDYAQASVEKLYFGERLWDREKYPNLLDFLKGAVDSLIYNDTISLSQKTESNCIDLKDDSIKDDEILLVNLIESEQEADKLRNIIREAIKGDDELELYFMHLENNYKPKEFSEEYGIDIKDVYNLIKRLKRITQNILEKEKSRNNG